MDKATKAEKDAKSRQAARTPTDLGSGPARDIAGALNVLLAHTHALSLKTKNLHWHISGPHFRTITCCWTSRRPSFSLQPM